MRFVESHGKETLQQRGLSEARTDYLGQIGNSAGGVREAGGSGSAGSCREGPLRIGRVFRIVAFEPGPIFLELYALLQSRAADDSARRTADFAMWFVAACVWLDPIGHDDRGRPPGGELRKAVIRDCGRAQVVTDRGA